MARSDLLCGLHKVCSHIMARSDLFICSPESSACHVVLRTKKATHLRIEDLFFIHKLTSRLCGLIVRVRVVPRRTVVGDIDQLVKLS